MCTGFWIRLSHCKYILTNEHEIMVTRTKWCVPQQVWPYQSELSLRVYFAIKCVLSQKEPSNEAVCVSFCVFLCIFVTGVLHPRLVTTVTRCSMPPAGLGQVGRHGDWVVTDFVTGPPGHCLGQSHTYTNINISFYHVHTFTVCTWNRDVQPRGPCIFSSKALDLRLPVSMCASV